MANKQQIKMQKAKIFAIRAQAWALLLEKLLPYFKYVCWLLLTYLLGPTGVTVTKSILKLIGMH